MGKTTSNSNLNQSRKAQPLQANTPVQGTPAGMQKGLFPVDNGTIGGKKGKGKKSAI